MFFARWLPTFLAFPLGGLIAEILGSIDDPLTAAAGGAIVGAVVGTAQWLALRPLGIGPRWAVYTTAALAAGSAVAAALTDSGTGVGSLMVAGLVAGAAVGGAQASLLGRGRTVAGVWTIAVAVSWSLGWLTTWAIGVDVEAGYAIFGSSGAAVATVLTGLVLYRLLGGAQPAPPEHELPAAEAGA